MMLVLCHCVCCVCVLASDGVRPIPNKPTNTQRHAEYNNVIQSSNWCIGFKIYTTCVYKPYLLQSKYLGCRVENLNNVPIILLKIKNDEEHNSKLLTKRDLHKLYDQL